MVIFLGSFYLLNIILAIVSMSYEQVCQQDMEADAQLAALISVSCQFSEHKPLAVLHCSLDFLSCQQYATDENEEDDPARPNFHHCSLTDCSDCACHNPQRRHSIAALHNLDRLQLPKKWKSLESLCEQDFVPTPHAWEISGSNTSHGFPFVDGNGEVVGKSALSHPHLNGCGSQLLHPKKVQICLVSAERLVLF